MVYSVIRYCIYTVFLLTKIQIPVTAKVMSDGHDMYDIYRSMTNDLMHYFDILFAPSVV